MWKLLFPLLLSLNLSLGCGTTLDVDDAVSLLAGAAITNYCTYLSAIAQALPYCSSVFHGGNTAAIIMNSPQ